jgi:hypothetical protein
MIAGVCRVFSALAIAAVPVVAVAQVIPPSELPGRQRERFVQPEAPQSQPGGAAVSLPSTTAPAGAENIPVVIKDIQIVGSTVYSREQLASLYQGMLGREWSLKSIYDLAQRITAKYGNDGYVGAATAGRKWINYEIEKAWKDGKGVLGIHIHNLKNKDGEQSTKGSNPFAGYKIGEKQMTDVVKTYDPPHTKSTNVYNYVKDRLEGHSPNRTFSTADLPKRVSPDRRDAGARRLGVRCQLCQRPVTVIRRCTRHVRSHLGAAAPPRDAGAWHPCCRRPCTALAAARHRSTLQRPSG